MSGGTHLRLEERERLAALKGEGLSLRAIARQLGRAASTISRELRRNALPKGGDLPATPRAATSSAASGRRLWSVTPSSAASSASVWWRVGRRSRSPAGSSVARSVGCGPSPPRRSTPSSTAPGRKARSSGSCCRVGGPGEGAVGLGSAQRHCGAALDPRPARGGPGAQGSRALGRRPPDLQADPPGAGAQRAQDPVRPRRQAAGKWAAETVAIMMAVFRRLDPRLRASITFDNDTAFARHGLLASACAMTTWFCDAYASWQKGAVGNAIGRLWRACRAISSSARWARPSCSCSPQPHPVTPELLGFLTPLQALLGELGRDVQIRSGRWRAWQGSSANCVTFLVYHADWGCRARLCRSRGSRAGGGSGRGRAPA